MWHRIVLKLMSPARTICSLLILLSLIDSSHSKSANPEPSYTPDWPSLDGRPIPEWYDKAKFGIFIHWGPYSVPAFSPGSADVSHSNAEWFQKYWQDEHIPAHVEYMQQTFLKNNPNFQYSDFVPLFTAEKFDPSEWAKLFRESGAKYVVPTSKHHDGFTLFPSPYTAKGWTADTAGPRRDLLGLLREAVLKEGLEFGLYYSLYEWFHPSWLRDNATRFAEENYILRKVAPERQLLVERYLPSVWWSDGFRGATDSYWRSKEFLAWLYSESPVRHKVVVNDRWGMHLLCKHGDFYNCWDRFSPGWPILFIHISSLPFLWISTIHYSTT